MLPEVLKGRWAWCPSARPSVETYLFFRREFMLDETPSTADLWVSARTYCQVFLNGRLVAYGPCPAGPGESNTLQVDAAYFLQTGRNVLAILAHNTGVARTSRRRQPGGVWAQLDIDGKPAIWTDETWRVRPGMCYERSRPRRSPQTEFTEKVDMRLYPHGWDENAVDEHDWHAPTVYGIPSSRTGRLLQPRGAEFSVTRREFPVLSTKGMYRQACALSYLCFADLVGERGPGVYAAETFFFSQRSERVRFKFCSDNPYRIFLNGRPVRQQGIDPLLSGMDYDRAIPPGFAQGELIEPEGTFAVEPGYNQLVVFQQVERDGAGLSILFPDFRPEKLVLARKKGPRTAPGWSIVGPLKTPLPHTSGTMDLADLPRASYSPELSTAANEAALLEAFEFYPDARTPEDTGQFELRENEYIILDMGQTVMGCPEMQITGSEADVVDIISGEEMRDGTVVLHSHGRQDVETVVCSAEGCHWTATVPRGLRYLMVVVRQSWGTVSFQGAGVQVKEFAFPNPGQFECADPVLSEIWIASRATLETTVGDGLMDSPTGENAQYIPDAMIQSWAGYHALGVYDVAAMSLEDFARGQFETGEMPAVYPSDRYVHAPDFSLLWPVWLQRHHLYTGNVDFLSRMTPALRRLFRFYAELAERDGGLLGDAAYEFGRQLSLNPSDAQRRGVLTGLNAVYCRSLFSGARILQELGDMPAAEALRDRAAEVIHRIRRLTWDPERALFADAWSQGERSEEHSWQANILALCGGLAPPNAYLDIFEKLFADERPGEPLLPGAADDPLFNHFVLETAAAIGKRQWAVEMIRAYWGAMIARGAKTFGRPFDMASGPGEISAGPLAYGASACPTIFLAAELVGIRPAAPGFGTAFFNPVLGVTDWVRAQIPTVHGHINVEWNFDAEAGLEAYIDANYPLELVPVLSPDVAEDAVLHVSDDVTIMVEEGALD